MSYAMNAKAILVDAVLCVMNADVKNVNAKKTF
jgi:hypothetical protein